MPMLAPCTGAGTLCGTTASPQGAVALVAWMFSPLSPGVGLLADSPGNLAGLWNPREAQGPRRRMSRHRGLSWSLGAHPPPSDSSSKVGGRAKSGKEVCPVFPEIMPKSAKFFLQTVHVESDMIRLRRQPE